MKLYLCSIIKSHNRLDSYVNNCICMYAAKNYITGHPVMHVCLHIAIWQAIQHNPY